MRRGMLVLIVVLALPGAAEARLTTSQLHRATGQWVEWITPDDNTTLPTINRCSRRRQTCHVRLEDSPLGDCTATVYIKRKRRKRGASEVVWRKRWVVGVTGAGMDCVV